MTEKNIKFTGDVIEAIKYFAAAATVCEYDVDVVSGRYVVDAKSIMGWFSLDSSMPMKVSVHAEESKCQDFLAKIAKFIV
ncbi:MAG: HPr family phosphocarrier protein [Oscillospiraceae bacterium]|nr:HPr family phosphocarrier protein [Oscillospiraceae bacterium]